MKPGSFAWNMERCEEILLIAAYEEIKPFIPAGEDWAASFENHFYQHGNAVAFYFIDDINAARRRKNLAKLDYKETDVLDYGRSPDKMMKSEFRQRSRREWEAWSTDERIRQVHRAVLEIAELRPPHIPFVEYKARQARVDAENAKSREDLRKMRALEMAAQPAATQAAPTLAAQKAATMLRHASAKLWPDIIARLSGDDALLLVEEIDNSEVRDALILHALNAPALGQPSRGC